MRVVLCQTQKDRNKPTLVTRSQPFVASHAIASTASVQWMQPVAMQPCDAGVVMRFNRDAARGGGVQSRCSPWRCGSMAMQLVAIARSLNAMVLKNYAYATQKGSIEKVPGGYHLARPLVLKLTSSAVDAWQIRAWFDLV
jgi:hypothetical protein